MVKLVVLFRRPRQGAEQLAAELLAGVVPHCRLIPGVAYIEIASTQAGLDWGRGDRRGPPFFMIELGFPDQSTCDSAMSSAQANTALTEMLELTSNEVTVFIAEGRRETMSA